MPTKDILPDAAGTVIPINGGAGRVIAALPALERRIKAHPTDIILAEGGLDFFVGNPLLQPRVYSPDHKDLFDTLIKDRDFIHPEPYRDRGYYTQARSLAEAWDHQINGVTDHSDLPRPTIYLTKAEEYVAAKVVADAKKHRGLDPSAKVVVVQPFGRSAQADAGIVFDPSSRSIEADLYLDIVKALHEAKFAAIYFGEHEVTGDPTLRPKLNLRQWAAVIEAADHFVGCDSVGQHMAHAFSKPATIVLGGTFAINVSYPGDPKFNIIEKKGATKTYSPIRIAMGAADFLPNALNDRLMEFTGKEREDLISRIVRNVRQTKE